MRGEAAGWPDRQPSEHVYFSTPPSPSPVRCHFAVTASHAFLPSYPPIKARHNSTLPRLDQPSLAYEISQTLLSLTLIHSFCKGKRTDWCNVQSLAWRSDTNRYQRSESIDCIPQ